LTAKYNAEKTKIEMEDKLRAHLKSEVANATPCQCEFPYKYGAKTFNHCN